MPRTSISVGIAQVRVQRGPALFCCAGLGSCVALVLTDSEAGVSGVAHIMLPSEFGEPDSDRPGKFADRALKFLLEEMEQLGATRQAVRAAFAGGAQVFRESADAGPSCLAIGAKNLQAVESGLADAEIPVVARCVGGTSARTVSFCSVSGEVRVQTVAGGEALLCTLP